MRVELDREYWVRGGLGHGVGAISTSAASFGVRVAQRRVLSTARLLGATSEFRPLLTAVLCFGLVLEFAAFRVRRVGPRDINVVSPGTQMT